MKKKVRIIIGMEQERDLIGKIKSFFIRRKLFKAVKHLAGLCPRKNFRNF